MDRSRAQFRVLIALVSATSVVVALASRPVASAVASPGASSPVDAAVAASTGAASFAIPIAVPPGPGGFAPALALEYSSRDGDGPFGIGWSLGLPEIRCSARFGVPDFASCANYELDDTLLRRGAQAGRYHTVVESFQRIQFLFGGSNPSWTVEQPNGTKLTFGESASHRILQGGTPARWLLERMEDPFGNTIFFAYDRSDPGEAYPASIAYGAGAGPGSGPRQIQFFYDPRADARLVFTGGVARKIQRRLREIQVVSNGAILRRYVFGYELSGVAYSTGRSRLSWVQEFGTDCTAADPVSGCGGRGLPRRTFRYRDASEVGSAQYSQSANDPAYRVPFGDYASSQVPLWRNNFPVLIGDLNGDGLPDRVEILSPSINALPASHSPRVSINTGTGFDTGSDVARQYRDSFRSLTYTKPRWEYQQIPAPRSGPPYTEYPNWNQHMYAMCSVTPASRTANLSQEQLARGVGARTSTLSQLRSDPAAGFFEPFPSVEMADLDADGLADLVVSTRLGGVDRHFDCDQPATPLAEPERFASQTVTVVFRNTGTGWVNDTAAQWLASGLPPFEEVLVKSTYQTEIDEPSQYVFWDYESADSPCANRSIWGFEQYLKYDATYEGERTAVCHNMIDLAPQFVDFNGDGYVDLAVLERDHPDRFWTGADYMTGAPYNTPRTRVWIQKPGGVPRWQRAPQYDLPSEAWPASPTIPGLAHAGLQHHPEGPGDAARCESWHGHFPSCSPNTYRFDNGVRLIDLNRDGLTDVVWSGMDQQGAFLNTGRGAPATRSSAWCASEPDDAPWVGSACPEAAAYRPPGPLARYSESYLPVSTGLLADLNGDGFADYVLEDLAVQAVKSFSSWLHDPGASASTVWKRDGRFDFYLECRNCQVPHPVSGQLLYADQFFPRFEAFDIDGDGADDVVGDTDAFLSRSRHSDLVRTVANGRGGSMEIEYDSMILQRVAALESDADAVPWAGDAGPVKFWRPTAVVSRVTAIGPNLAPPGDVTEYRYAHPRFSTALRSDLGFGLVQRTRPSGAAIEEFFYQDPGRTGRTARRLVKDAGQVVHRYEATWQPVSGVIPGTIAGVYLARLVEEHSANEYGGVAGALHQRSYSYDDAYGFNFLAAARTERASTAVDTIFEPEPQDPTRWIMGLIRSRREEIPNGIWISDSEFSYMRGKLAVETRWRERRARGESAQATPDTTQLFYDDRGNLSRRIDANGHSTEFSYDTATRSVLVEVRDPLGNVTALTPHPIFGIPVVTDPGFRDVPAEQVELDPFGRIRKRWLLPTDGASPVLVAAASFHDDASPPYVESFEYTSLSGEAGDAIRTVAVDDGFGGVWKTVRDNDAAADGGERFIGTATYRDPARRTSRTTYDVPCDALCTGATGAVESAATVTRTDALGRPVEVATPEGRSLSHYRVANRPIVRGAGIVASSPVDLALSQNAKGDLVLRGFDGDRVVAVEECANPPDPGRTSLAGVTCSAAAGVPNRTLYGYHANGQLEVVYDVAAVAASSWSDASHSLRYHFNTVGHVIQVDDPDAGTSKTIYDGVGNVVATVNARGDVRGYGHDALDRLTTVGSSVASEGTVTVAYDPGKLQRRRESGSGYTIDFGAYDTLGRLAQESITTPGRTAVAAAYEYDLLGRLTAARPAGARRGAQGNVYKYAGAFLKQVCRDRTCAAEIIRDVTYDDLGRREVVVLPQGTRRYAYTSDTRRLRSDAFVSANGGTTAFEYSRRDGLGNVLEWSTSSPLGGMTSGSYEYDSRNRLISWTRNGEQEGFAYDLLGNLVQHGAATQTYAHAAKPHAITQRVEGQETRTYSHGPAGNVASVVTQSSQPSSARHYTFDSADRLVCAGTSLGGCDVLRVRYDLSGRRIYEQAGGAGGTTRRYIGDAFIFTKNGATGEETVRTEAYAFEERVGYFEAITTASSAAELTAWGFEIPPWVPLALPPLAGLAWGLALALRGGLLLGVARRPGTAALCGMLGVSLAIPCPATAGGGSPRPTIQRWVLSDRLGSGIVELDETGAAVRHTRFEPFGGVDREWDPAPATNQRVFAGHREQKETHLFYMNARWMDPATGTFLSVDPVVVDASDPQSYNGYGYARNNPVNLSDATGSFWETPWTELQNCNRCSGFAWSPGFYLGIDGSSGWVTSMVDFNQIAGQLDQTRAAFYGWGVDSPGHLTPLDVVADIGMFLKGLIDFVIGEDFGAAWRQMLLNEWVEGPWGGVLPEALLRTLKDVRESTPSNANANGMHAWHAGSNAALAKQLGLVGAPLILIAGLLHELPVDFRSFMAEQRYQGTVNHVLDSATDVGANIFGLALGYAIPRGATAVSAALELGNFIPGPGEPDPAFGGPGAYTGSPSAAWGQYP